MEEDLSSLECIDSTSKILYHQLFEHSRFLSSYKTYNSLIDRVHHQWSYMKDHMVAI
jgi:hypothetical protein